MKIIYILFANWEEMSDKDILIKILTRLLPYRDKAEGLLYILKNIEVSEDTLKKLATFLSNAIKKVKKLKQQEKYHKALAHVQSIQWSEESFDEDSLNKLLDNI